MSDTTLFNLIEKEKSRQLKGLELIASENFVSENVMNQFFPMRHAVNNHFESCFLSR